ncbi:MAG: hypothetical protein ACI4VF_03025 [Lachnospirales bacterium]
MTINDALDMLLKKALENENLKKKLIETENADDPVAEFCKISCEEGIEITEGDLFALNEIMLSNLLKSTNGGATYPIEDWADTYEQFICSLKIG